MVIIHVYKFRFFYLISGVALVSNLRSAIFILLFYYIFSSCWLFISKNGNKKYIFWRQYATEFSCWDAFMLNKENRINWNTSFVCVCEQIEYFRLLVLLHSKMPKYLCSNKKFLLCLIFLLPKTKSNVLYIQWVFEQCSLNCIRNNFMLSSLSRVVFFFKYCE